MATWPTVRVMCTLAVVTAVASLEGAAGQEICSHVLVQGAYYGFCNGTYSLTEPCYGNPQWRLEEPVRYLFTLGGDVWLIADSPCVIRYFHMSDRNLKYPWNFNENITVSCAYGPNIFTLTPPGPPIRITQESDTLSLRCHADCSPPCDVTWTGPSLSGRMLPSSGELLELDDLDKDDAGLYTCHASNSLGNKSMNVSLVVHHAPTNVTMTTAEDEITLVENADVMITCFARCSPDCDFHWTFRPEIPNDLDLDSAVSNGAQRGGNIVAREATVDQRPSTGGKAPLASGVAKDLDESWMRRVQTTVIQAGRHLNLSAITRLQRGRYLCIANNSMGRGETAVDVTVNYAPSEVTLQQDVTQRLPSDGHRMTATVRCSASCSPACDFQWDIQKYDSNADDNSNVIHDVTERDAAHGGKDGNRIDALAGEDEKHPRGWMELPDNSSVIETHSDGLYRCTASNSLGSSSKFISALTPKVQTAQQTQPSSVQPTWTVALPVIGLLVILLAIASVGIVRRRSRVRRNVKYQENIRREKPQNDRQVPSNVTNRCRVENAYSDIWDKRITLSFEITDEGLKTTLGPGSDDPITLGQEDAISRENRAKETNMNDVTDVVDMRVEYFRQADCGPPTESDNYLDMSGSHGSDLDYINSWRDNETASNEARDKIYQNDNFDHDQAPVYLDLQG